MKRGALIAAVVLAIGAFACERKHDEPKAGETTTTSGTVHEEQSTGSGYNYQGSPGVTGGGTTNSGNINDDTTGTTDVSGASTGTDRNAQPSGGSATGSTTGMGSGSGVSGSSLSADQSGSTGAMDAGVVSDIDKKAVDKKAPATGATGTSKAKSGDNKSTPLGDGTSGQYTGGKGTYGGKDTHGTGDTENK